MSDTTDRPLSHRIPAGHATPWVVAAITDLERQLAEARMAFAVVTDELVVEQSAHRRAREQIDRIADALRGIRKNYPWKVDPECECEDCEFCRPIDEALATLDRKEDA